MCGNPVCRTILSPAMIAYALGARTVRNNSTNSRTPPLGTAFPRHPVFVRGINGQGREFLEFCTLLNESAGGALLAIRRPLRRRSRISLEMPPAPILRNVKLRQTMRRLRARVVRVSPIDGWNLCGLQFARPLI